MFLLPYLTWFAMSEGSVLERVKRFLPELARANLELAETIKTLGVQAVQIDQHLTAVDSGGDAVGDDNVLNTDAEDAKAEGDKNGAGMEPCFSRDSTSDDPIVKLEFAIGDFDNTLIARAEEESQLQTVEDDK